VELFLIFGCVLFRVLFFIGKLVVVGVFFMGGTLLIRGLSGATRDTNCFLRCVTCCCMAVSLWDVFLPCQRALVEQHEVESVAGLFRAEWVVPHNAPFQIVEIVLLAA
jgi:hypothetical protein